MSPDDPRHGTEAGCSAHYRHGERPCRPCLDDHMRRNKLRALYPHKVAALGSQRRVQALQAMGYSRLRVAQECGYADNGSIAYLMRADTMLVATARRIAEVYDRLSMTPPEGPGVNRARTWARRHGYVPPLAWDDIDDPNEHPTGWQYIATDRAEALRDLIATGAGLTEACRRLDLAPATLQKWCGNTGHSHLYRALAAREGEWNATGRYGREGAA